GYTKTYPELFASGIMPARAGTDGEGGVSSPRTEGTPQGSPLNPLLSNIVLDEPDSYRVDKALLARGHRFVRYADDCSIYVKSEKSAHRVMDSITEYIESKLKLKVNRTKSKISRPEESTLLGFSFYRSKEGWQVRIAPKSMDRIKKKMKENTKRNDPSPAKEKIKENGSSNPRMGQLLCHSQR
nr:reverse transcriptase domain-containing protein [Bacteroidota bacterium]